jgi:RTX calcium-binding nonapeptide repeat (4 copies)
MKRKLSAAVFFAVAVSLLVVPSSQAFTATPVWKCRASTTYASVAGNNRIEPIVANGKPNTANGAQTDNAQCADADVGAGNLLTPLGIPLGTIAASTTTARTKITPELGLAINQKTDAFAQVEGLRLGTALTVSAATSGATGRCAGGVPVLQGSSNVLGINTTNLDPLIQAIANLLSVAPNLISVRINEQVRTPDSLTVRAVHVKVLAPSNGAPPLLDLVIAESKVGFNGPVCDPDQQGPGTGKVCPPGSTYDPERNLCIIIKPGGGIIIVGRPFEGPTGGTVVPLDEARRRFGNSACLRGNRAPLFAIIGTNGADRITGTNRADRVLARGGKDSVSGGRGNDCLDGGTGGDNLSGSIGNDRIYGRTGTDHLNGASGTDYLNAGAGNDSINAGFGRDRAIGGSGRDFINVATAGPPASVNCGAGRDKVRVNFVERNRTRGCEVRYVFSDRFRR